MSQRDVDYLREQVEFCRIVFGVCCAELAADQEWVAPLESSLLSLGGLAEHLAEAERDALRRAARAVPPRCDLFVPSGRIGRREVLRDWQESCSLARGDIERAIASADPVQVSHGQLALIGLLAEYSRHNVQAQIVRARIDR